MAKNYWMFVQSPENFAITKDLGFTLHGLGPKYRKRAERMRPDDRVLFYVSGLRKWVATATITSRYFEDNTPIWQSVSRNGGYPYRVKLAPNIVVDEADYIDALILAPRLEYVKRWAPEDWPLAFFDRLHLLPQRDFRLIEGEMSRIVNRGRRRGRGRPNDYSERRREDAQAVGQDSQHDAVGDTDGSEAPAHSPASEITHGVIEGSPPGEGAHRTPQAGAGDGNAPDSTAEGYGLRPDRVSDRVDIESPPPGEGAAVTRQAETDSGSHLTSTTETHSLQPSGDPEHVVVEGSPVEHGAHVTRPAETDGGSPPASNTETYSLRPSGDPESIVVEGSSVEQGAHGTPQTEADGEDPATPATESGLRPSNEDPERP